MERHDELLSTSSGRRQTARRPRMNRTSAMIARMMRIVQSMGGPYPAAYEPKQPARYNRAGPVAGPCSL